MNEPHDRSAGFGRCVGTAWKVARRHDAGFVDEPLACGNIDVMTERPFRVLGIQQIAIGGLDKGALAGLWTGLLGVEKVGDYVSESENVDEDILRLGVGPACGGDRSDAAARPRTIARRCTCRR